MNSKDLKKILAGLGIASLISGAGLVVGSSPAFGGGG